MSTTRKTTTKRTRRGSPPPKSQAKHKIYQDENGNKIENKKGLPTKITPEVERDALESLAKVPVDKEKPKIVGNKKVYETRLQGQVWRPEDEENREKLYKLLEIYYAHFSGDGEVAEMLGVRVDTLKNWLKKYPDLHEAKNSGNYGLKVQYLTAVQKAALGGTYKRQVVSKGQVFDVEEEHAPDVRALKMVLQQSFKGQFREDADVTKVPNINIAILPGEKGGL